MMYLKQKESDTLVSLAKYKFLCSSQFTRLGLYKNKGDVTNLLKPMTEQKKPLIGVIKFPTDPTIGKLEYIYYLTKFGEKVLLEDLDYPQEKIKKVKSKPISTKDYFHRRATIDLHIGLNQWLQNNNGEIKFLNYYFDKVGTIKNKDNKSVIEINRFYLENGKSFIPDISTKFRVNNENYIFLFEQHNGKDSKRLIDQLHIHLLAISQDVVSKKFKFNKSNRVAIVCEEKSVKDAVIQRLQKTDVFNTFHNFFIFKTNDELKEDFFNNWTLINGEQVSFIQKSNSNLSNNEVI
ncbi:hypothetical protein [Arcobacter ellisii]|uniref:Uncharacterized protein n=1 Tax=Arcobacter ellisii TaxID=913109 RepID=A0A347UA52_9BACT|nr:hypothetical protein [Arcobacter ellisii]AXX95730.1 hypothetical protein AELL_2088 [Arcobacter ellisii]RXI31398.1 hypothetical protein CP962_04600 [Arcobacter ellisii]